MFATWNSPSKNDSTLTNTHHSRVDASIAEGAAAAKSQEPSKKRERDDAGQGDNDAKKAKTDDA